MNILIAPNAFKNSASAGAAAAAIADGLEASRLRCDCVRFPVADGGDGTAELLVAHFRGTMTPISVHDPLGRTIVAPLGMADGVAIVGMADASGLRLLQSHERAPLRTTSFGTGELIKAALERGAREFLIGVGGSATVDGGAGILQALGAQLLDADSMPLPAEAEALRRLEAIDLSGLDTRLRDCRMTILCDVDNPLLGANGAAFVFGPQKGATPQDVQALETALVRFSEAVSRRCGIDISALPGGGAAGGVAAGLHGVLGAKLVRGAEYFLEVTRFNDALASADLVFTGEGSIDEQTLKGKAPYEVARRARQREIPVVALAGMVPLAPSAGLRACFDALLPINERPSDIRDAMKHTLDNLKRTACEIGNLLALKQGASHTTD